MDNVQTLLAALKQGNDKMIGYGKDASNVARLAFGMPELYPERPTGPLRDMGHNFDAYNWLRQKLGLDPAQDPNAQPVYQDGTYVGQNGYTPPVNVR